MSQIKKSKKNGKKGEGKGRKAEEADLTSVNN